jgi:carbonic anhydrase/acetyltransferase-like protein (isoleucine patch superfamily)
LVPATLALLWAVRSQGVVTAAFVAPAVGIIFLLVFVALVAIVRQFLPRPLLGVCSAPSSPEYRKMLLWLYLQRYVYNALLHDAIFFFVSIRYLCLRALGANIHHSVVIQSKVFVYDPFLVTIGRDSSLGVGAVIICHIGVGNRLLIAPVRFGERCVVGAWTRVAPGVSAGDDVHVEAACDIGPLVRIGNGAVVKAGCAIASSVIIGDRSSVDTASVVGNGTRIGVGSRIRFGSIIPRGTVIGDYEIWGGAPARRLGTVSPDTEPPSMRA